MLGFCFSNATNLAEPQPLTPRLFPRSGSRAMRSVSRTGPSLHKVGFGVERAKETTRFGKYTYIEYARFADDLVILIDAHPRHGWLMGASCSGLVGA
jgi:hypothetical protein